MSRTAHYDSELIVMCDITEDLSAKKRYQEAARVLLDYAQDVREAVIALVQGNQFSEARSVVRISLSTSDASMAHTFSARLL